MRLFWLIGQGSGSRGGRAVIALAAIGLILVAGNVIVQRFAAVRLDLTAEQLYTLAPGTRRTLAKIEEPIALRYYYSSRLGEAVPAYGVYGQRVRGLLDQYVAAAHGKLRLEVYDPQPFTDAEDRAVAYRLQAVPLNDQGEPVYFGLAATNSTDDQQVIAFFNPERERFLEYDLTRLIHALALPKRTVVGLMSSLPLVVDPTAPLQGKPVEPLAIVKQLRQVDDVEPLSTDTETIPAKIDVLMLVHPQKLSDATLFAIDQFVLNGGKAIVFVDPYSEMQAALPSPHAEAAAAAPPASDLAPLFKAWGLTMLPGVVAGDRQDARRVAVPVEGRPPQTMDYVGWLNLPAANLDPDDPITANLHEITMATAGILEPAEGATTHFQPLIRTSLEAEKLPVDKVKDLPDVAALLAQFRPEQRQFVLAAHVTGDVKTAFPDGKPSPPPSPHDAGPQPEPSKDSAPPVAALKQSVKPVNIVVVADTDMLDDRFWAQSRDFFGQRVVEPVSNNADFLANAIEVLAGGEDLIGLRSRGSAARPFEVVERIQRAADARYAAEQQNLQQKLKQAEAKLRSLTGGKGEGGSQPAATAEQAKEIDQFRADMLATRQQLRQVQAAERQDIRHLKVILEFFDIALMPIVVIAAAVVLAALRRRRVARG
ncbi:MAG: Gldg family protein [Alphaproteobacteria bacterium]|nr:Gldg family protein [Alphaproteobacteria bacterium]